MSNTTKPQYNIEVLRRAAAEKGISTSQLALAARVTSPTAYRLMRGDGCHPSTVKKVAKALGVAMADLLPSKKKR